MINELLESRNMATGKKIVMVTGGAGLVGKGLQDAILTDSKSDEEWIFLSSKDADLRSAPMINNCNYYLLLTTIHTLAPVITTY